MFGAGAGKGSRRGRAGADDPRATPWHRAHVIVPGAACAVHTAARERDESGPRAPGPAPLRVWAGRRGWHVAAVEACWREWHVGPAGTPGAGAATGADGAVDLECWRVRLEPPLVAVLCRDIRTDAWHVRDVWD